MAVNEQMRVVELSCGMEAIINGRSTGYLGDGCSMTITKTEVDLYQGEPAVFCGSRIAKMEGVVNIPFLAQTPEVHALASGNGEFVGVETTSSLPENEFIHLTGVQEQRLRHQNIDAETIVVKSADGVTTYTEDTDYTVVVDGPNTGLKRTSESGIESGAEVSVDYEFSDTQTTPYLFGGAARPQTEIGPIVLHKYNPGGGQHAHHIIAIWRGMPQGDYTQSYDMESQSWLTQNVAIKMISDASNTQQGHDKCPLFMELWEDEGYEFNPQQVPTVPADYVPLDIFGISQAS